ncbi:MAG TPA: hypothetical protein VGB72_08780, partial [Acidobacteriota bacterium]
MNKTIPILAVLLCVSAAAAAPAEGLNSLSRVFSLGHGLADSDGDGLADSFAFRIVIPDRPTAEEAAAAADIAGRANLESLAADFDLVVPESRFLRDKKAGAVILIG